MSETQLIRTEAMAVSPTTADAPSKNPAFVYLSSLSPSTRPGSKQRLRRATGFFMGEERDIFTFNWASIRYPHLVALRSRLAESGLSVGGCNCILSCVKAVLRECWRLQLLTGEDFHRAIDVKSIRGSSLPRGRALEVGEVQSLFRCCSDDSGASGDRDAAALSILLAGGLRRQELVDLDLQDYDEATGSLMVRHGKGNKGRQCYLCRSAREILNFWLKRRGKESGPLLGKCRKGRNGRIVLERLGTSAIYRALNKRARQAGVKRFSPHDCRRTFVSDLLDRGGDLAMVQRLAGHSSPSTTSLYDRRPEELKKRQAELLVLPLYKVLGHE